MLRALDTCLVKARGQTGLCFCMTLSLADPGLRLLVEAENDMALWKAFQTFWVKDPRQQCPCFCNAWDLGNEWCALVENAVTCRGCSMSPAYCGVKSFYFRWVLDEARWELPRDRQALVEKYDAWRANEKNVLQDIGGLDPSLNGACPSRGQKHSSLTTLWFSHG